MIEVTRQAQAGDRVKVKVLRDLMERTLEGVVSSEISPYGAKVLIDDENDPISVRWSDMTAMVSDRDVLKYLIQRIRLIAAQDQGAGGNMTPEECWRSAQRLALETLTSIKVGDYE